MEKTIEQPTKQSVNKQKELRCAKSLQKDDAGPSTLFRFDILAQLANIPIRITLYKLLRLSKSTREALREALVNSEVFLGQMPTMTKEKDDEHCNQASRHSPPITFSPRICKSRRSMTDPLYYIGYIRSSEVSRIQVDPGSALSILPRRVMQHLRIPTY